MSSDPGLTITTFQKIIEDTYGAKDAARGLGGTFMWFTEEVGELARALKRREPDRANLIEEFSDVLAWLCTLASIAGIDMEEAARRYAAGCPRCSRIPCACGERTRFQELPPAAE
ncbi:MAG TPA: MazG nucleotide pyrophosphohydrolase domain-containing protein [Planctomycetota bacterium]|nr:MazG nucleotide pyrophosphohydrolase domain-containing protein [Planctomycetota bacterium]